MLCLGIYFRSFRKVIYHKFTEKKVLTPLPNQSRTESRRHKPQTRPLIPRPWFRLFHSAKILYRTRGKVVATERSALSLSEALQEFREQRGLSRRALSYKAGLSASYVGKLEAGFIEPSVRAFAVIAVALQLTSYGSWLTITLAPNDGQ